MYIGTHIGIHKLLHVHVCTVHVHNNYTFVTCKLTILNNMTIHYRMLFMCILYGHSLFQYL